MKMFLVVMSLLLLGAFTAPVAEAGRTNRFDVRAIRAQERTNRVIGQGRPVVVHGVRVQSFHSFHSFGVAPVGPTIIFR